MNAKPSFGLQVSDLHRSIHFYRDRLGLTVDIDETSHDVAILTTPRGQHLVIAGPDAPPWDALLDEPRMVHPPNDKLFISSDPQFDARLERLSAQDSVPFKLIERDWGDRMLEVTDPDGYALAISSNPERSRSEILELLRRGRDEIRLASEGLGEAEQSWRPDADAWSVREVIHHVADLEVTVFHMVRVALANPGIEYRSNPPDLHHYAAELRYQEREIEPSLRLIEAIRDQLLELVELIPNSWDRSIRSSTGSETTVEEYLHLLATHTLEHLEQIRDIRRAMGA